jgi:hypothetical protein
MSKRGDGTARHEALIPLVILAIWLLLQLVVPARSRGSTIPNAGDSDASSASRATTALEPAEPRPLLGSDL